MITHYILYNIVMHKGNSLGHSDGLSYSHAEFGPGDGQIFLDAVQCSSYSNQLLECHTSPILTFSIYCDHSRDAGVGCERKYFFW